MKKVIFFLSMSFARAASAQVGENVYPFLNTPASSRQAALGGDAISVRDGDVSFAGINPALMNLEMTDVVSVNYAFYLADSHYGTINYVRDLGRGNLLSFSARYMDYGKIPRTDESGDISGDFSASDAAFGVGYAIQFEDEWTAGANINYVTSKIDNYTSAAVAASAGITWHREQSKETVALVFRNFGYQFKTFNGTRERLPFRADIGYTKILEGFPLAVTVTAHDLQQLNISSDFNSNNQPVGLPRKIIDHFSLGLELFPEDSFNLRIGYNAKRGNELAVFEQRSFAGLSFGFGIRISSFKFDYSHMRYSTSSNVNQIGITADLVQLMGGRR